MTSAMPVKCFASRAIRPTLCGIQIDIYDENCVEYTHSFQPTVLIHEIQAFHLINTFIIQCHFLEYNNAQNDNKYHAVFVL